MEIRLTKLKYRTKDIGSLIPYLEGKQRVDLPVVYVYSVEFGECGEPKDALRVFEPLGSYILAEKDSEYLAFPLRGSMYVSKKATLHYRVENKVERRIKTVCDLCPEKIRKDLSGSCKCDSINMLRQLNPMKIKGLKPQAWAEEIAQVTK